MLPDTDRNPQLVLRDLLRGCSASMPLWSLSSLIKKIRNRSNEISDLFDKSDLLCCNICRKRLIKKWLKKNKHKKNKTIINFLAEDPPLFFFILFEAFYTKTDD